MLLDMAEFGGDVDSPKSGHDTIIAQSGSSSRPVLLGPTAATTSRRVSSHPSDGESGVRNAGWSGGVHMRSLRDSLADRHRGGLGLSGNPQDASDDDEPDDGTAEKSVHSDSNSVGLKHIDYVLNLLN